MPEAGFFFSNSHEHLGEKTANMMEPGGFCSSTVRNIWWLCRVMARHTHYGEEEGKDFPGTQISADIYTTLSASLVYRSILERPQVCSSLPSSNMSEPHFLSYLLGQNFLLLRFPSCSWMFRVLAVSLAQGLASGRQQKQKQRQPKF